MKFETRSEELFSMICSRHGYKVTKITPRSEDGLKTADFSVETPSGMFIAEVKELTPNPDNLREFREMDEKGSTNWSVEIGKRARKAIRAASKQLRKYRDRNIPLLIVLYDNVRAEDGIRALWPMCHLEENHIDAAMYGDRVACIELGEGITKHPDRSGGGQTTTADEKIYISAVAVISDWDNESMLVYQNYYATIPFPQNVFTDSKCKHYRKGEGKDPHSEPWKWYQV